jgi:hypothetical protein
MSDGCGPRCRRARESRGELLDEDPEVAVDGCLDGLDLLHLAVEGGPAHPLGLGDVVED